MFGLQGAGDDKVVGGRGNTRDIIRDFEIGTGILELNSVFITEITESIGSGALLHLSSASVILMKDVTTTEAKDELLLPFPTMLPGRH